MHRLKYTFNSLCAMEETAHRPLNELAENDFTSLRLLLFGALLPTENITLEDTGHLIQEHIENGGTLKEINEYCIDALLGSGLTDG